MALYTYGGNPAAVLTDTAGNVVPDYPVLVKVAGTGATVTALFEEDGTTPIAELRSNPTGSDTPGAIRTFKAADVPAIEYEYNGPSGQPVRWYEVGREVAQDALAQAVDALKKSEGGTVTAATTFSDGLAFSGGLTGDHATFTGDVVVGGVLLADGVALSGMNIFDPHTYGAVGDGVNNDAVAIQAALNDARDEGGGWVLVPPGTYRLATLPLRIYGNTRLTLMPGATMVRAVTGTMLLNGDAEQDFGGYTGHGNILIEGGTWDADGTVVTSSNMVFSIGHARNVTIRDVTVLNVPGFHAVECNAVHTGRVIDCTFLGFIDTGGRSFSEAVQLDLAKGSAYFGGFGPYDDTPCVDILVQGCTIGPSGTAGTTSWGRGVGSHSASPDKPHRDIRVVDCRFQDTLEWAVGAYTWEGAVVSGLHMRGCGGGAWVRTLNSATASHRTPAGAGSPSIAGSQPLTGIVVDDITMVGGGGYGAAVHVQGEGTGYVRGLNLGRVTVRDVGSQAVRLVHVEDYVAAQVTAASTGGTAISTLGTRRGRIADCHVDGATGAGITLDSRSTDAASATDVAITDCTVTGTTANGIHIWDGADITVADCDLHDLTGIGVQVSTNTARPTIRNVRTRGTTGAGINLTSTVTGSRREGNTADAGGAATVATIASSTAETAVASWTIPAADAVAGVAYRFVAQGQASTTGTPTLTIRVRLGGAAGVVLAAFTAVTTSSGISGRGWRVVGDVQCVTPGGSGTWVAGAELAHHLNNTVGQTQRELTDGTVTRDSTADQVLVVTAQWGTASASNTASGLAGALQRITP